MLNPYTYTQFLVTDEPFEEPDPHAGSVAAGTELVSPFGQWQQTIYFFERSFYFEFN